MTGFEPQTSGIGSDSSTNWATTTALFSSSLYLLSKPCLYLFLSAFLSTSSLLFLHVLYYFCSYLLSIFMPFVYLPKSPFFVRLFPSPRKWFLIERFPLKFDRHWTDEAVSHFLDWSLLEREEQCDTKWLNYPKYVAICNYTNLPNSFAFLPE